MRNLNFPFLDIVFLTSKPSIDSSHSTKLSKTDSFILLAIKQACVLETFIDDRQLNAEQLFELMKGDDKTISLFSI